MTDDIKKLTAIGADRSPNIPIFEELPNIERLSRKARESLAIEIAGRLGKLKQENALYFYQAVSEETFKIHLSMAIEIIIVGGNRSTKTDTMLAEAVIQMTGIIPKSLFKVYPTEKIRPPIRVRIICPSLLNSWDLVIKPKLQWWQWNGRGNPQDGQGHYGWIPRSLLKNGKWENSWSEKHRTLTLINGSSFQVNSYDQDVEDLTGGSFHLIIHDEGPPHGHYRENKMRTLDTQGRLMIGMTPPDDQGAAWDAAWIYDELYEKGLPGPDKDPQIDAFTLFTEDNRILSKDDIQTIAKGLSTEQKEVRLKGRFLHLSGRIYPTYSDRPQWWCFHCNEIVLVENNICISCQSPSILRFTHLVEPVEVAYSWPTVFILDPHPRKPHAMLWIAVDPTDDWWITHELELDAQPSDVADRVETIERDLHIKTRLRLMDPNMGKTPSGMRRGLNVQQEFEDAGLRCDCADDNRDTARTRIKEMLKPDYRTRSPRLKVFNECQRFNFQMNRYSWSEWARHTSTERDPKPIPRPKDDDFPTCLGYFANSNQTYRSLSQYGQVYSRFKEKIYG